MDRRGSRGLQDEQRLQDYLDDQLREAGDLEGIEGLLARVGEQQTLLQSQVRSQFNVLWRNAHSR
jgi:hypothetical protein